MNKKIKSVLFANGIKNLGDVKIIGIKDNFLEIYLNEEFVKIHLSVREKEEIKVQEEFDEINNIEDDFWKDIEKSVDNEIDLDLNDDIDLDSDIELDDLIVEEKEVIVEKKEIELGEIIDGNDVKKSKTKTKKSKDDNLIDIL